MRTFLWQRWNRNDQRLLPLFYVLYVLVVSKEPDYYLSIYSQVVSIRRGDMPQPFTEGVQIALWKYRVFTGFALHYCVVDSLPNTKVETLDPCKIHNCDAKRWSSPTTLSFLTMSPEISQWARDGCWYSRSFTATVIQDSKFNPNSLNSILFTS